MNISAVSSGGGQIVFGDSSGYIHIADRQFNLSSFQAYGVAVTHLYQLKQRNVLVSVGVRALSTQRFVFVFCLTVLQDDEEGINPTIKVWHLDKSDKDKNPFCTRVMKVTYENRAFPVRCARFHS